MVSDATPTQAATADLPADAAAAHAAQRLADAQTRLQAWQVLGLQRTEPLRLARLQSLARRLAQLLQACAEASAGGEAAVALNIELAAAQARLMSERLGTGVAELAQRLRASDASASAAAAPAPGPTVAAVAPAAVKDASGCMAHKAARPPARSAAPAEPREPGPLGCLVQALDAAAAGAADGASSAAAVPAQAAGAALAGPLELKVLREARGTWARLGAQRQLARSLAQAPANAGPLNSHQLLLRALQQMQQLSPGYLLHFMAHADTLLWLEQACGPKAGPPSASPAKGVPAARPRQPQLRRQTAQTPRSRPSRRGPPDTV